ncbi:MAG: putative membrane protein [Bacteriovoracaceae bacterium]
MALKKSVIIFALSLFSGLIFNLFFFNLAFLEVLSIYTWLGSLLLGSFFGSLIFTKMGHKELIPFALPISLLLCSWLSWLILHLIPLNLSVPLLLIFGGLGFYKQDREEKLSQLKYLNAFIIIFWLILICLSFHPEIYWGEKPMDFNLFNFFGRNTEFPPNDPWFSGHRMKYYYFGYFMFGGMGESLGINSAISYHFSLATTAGSFFLAGLALMKNLGHRYSKALMGSGLLFFGSSLGSLSAYFLEGKRGYLAFWGATRVFKNHWFSEFPSWSFLFADLHPHVMSYPFALFGFVILHKIVSEDKREYSFLECFIFGFSLFSLLVINSWDIIFLTFLFLPLFLVNYKKTFLNKSFYYSILFGIGAWGISLLSLLGRGGNSVIRVFDGESNSLLNYFSHQGAWWILGAFLLIKNKEKISKNLIIFGLSYVGLLIFTENIVFLDRMNTIFKFGNQLFILAGCFCLLLYKETKYANTILSLGLAFFVSVFFFNQFNINHYDPFGSTRPTLDGSYYLRKTANEDRLFIDYINENIKGTPLLLESYGKSFENNRARISMHTGLPTYLGWEGHVIIRGADARATLRRKKEIDAAYSSTDPIKTYEWLVKTGIKYLVVGGAEHVKYEEKGIAKFNQYIDLFTPVIQTRRGNKIFGLYKVGK